MNHKNILPAQGKITTATKQPGAGPREHATHSRTFAEILAEAEAVQDQVLVQTLPGDSPMVGLDGALRGVAGMLMGPTAGTAAAMPDEKPRRNAGRGR